MVRTTDRNELLKCLWQRIITPPLTLNFQYDENWNNRGGARTVRSAKPKAKSGYTN